MATMTGRRVAVVSPHLDDAALSIGGTIHRLASAGVSVHIVTVFAGDPDDFGPPSYWDASRGASSHHEVALRRRDEDRAAARILGATTAWLPFADNGYLARRDPDVIWERLAAELSGCDLVIVPGWPLSHADHRYAALLTLRGVDRTTPIGFYAEMPYAAEPIQLLKARLRGHDVAPIRHAYGDVVSWRRHRLGADDRQAKARACAAYAGELASLGMRARWSRIQGAMSRGEWLGIGTRVPVPAGLVTR